MTRSGKHLHLNGMVLRLLILMHGLLGPGNGVYYVPVTKIRYSKKVLALRFGSGADNWLDFYGYKGPKLAK